MTNSTIETRNLDRYGHAALPWARARDLLAACWTSTEQSFFVTTISPEARPHSAAVGAAWVDDALYFVSGPGTRKSRNLAANPACTVSVRLKGIDVVLEGDAHRVTDISTLDRIAALYHDSGWPAVREGEAFTAPYNAPSAGPAPWYLYKLTLRSAHAVATEEPHGATRWTFSRGTP